MRTIVFATTNSGKLAELTALLGSGWNVLSAKDFPNVPEVVEDADSFEGNAKKKAMTLAYATGELALADDSGLCVDALGGRPGVFSARYAPDDAARHSKLLTELHGLAVEKRTARFVCVLCVASPDGELKFARGECEGRIAAAPRGSQGFGYDPIFEVADGRTLAEMARDEKAKLSHRGRAFAQVDGLLRQLRK